MYTVWLQRWKTNRLNILAVIKLVGIVFVCLCAGILHSTYFHESIFLSAMTKMCSDLKKFIGVVITLLLDCFEGVYS